METKNKFLKFILTLVRFRWLVAGLIFCVLVFLKIHFSSIGVYHEIFPSAVDQQKRKEYQLYGTDKSIRSDEWAVHTPSYLSQKFNNYKKYSNRSSFGEMNTVLDYYKPAKDLSLIGKPFNLGYILFGNEYGFSFYFCMLELLLFMTAFEMFFIITKKRLLISFMGTMLVGFAPTLQWFLIPHVGITFVYAMALFSVTYHLFTCKKNWQKILFCILFISSFVGFCLSLFPSLQIAFVYSMVALLVAVFYRDKEKFCFDNLKKVLFFLALLFSFLVLLQFYISSKEELFLLNNTSYPGKRSELCGRFKLENYFTSLTNLFLPFKILLSYSNNSEIADFLHFAPILIFLFFKIDKILKQEKSPELYVGRTIFATLLIEMFFMGVGLSEMIAKITLLDKVNRVNINYGFTAVIFTIWCFNILWTRTNMLGFKKVFKYCTIYGIFYFLIIDSKIRSYEPIRYLVPEIFVFVLILFFALLRRKKIATFLTSAVMFVSGGLVNPINQGLEPLTNHPISKFVEEKAKKSDDLWLCLEGYVPSGILLANGARCLGSTNFYPDQKLWKTLKINQKYYEAYNRYAHHTFVLTNDEKKVEMLIVDSIKIYINPEDLKKLNVKYVFVRCDNAEFKNFKWPNDIKVTKEFEKDNFKILSLKY